MAQPVETEIKLAASPTVLDALRLHPHLAGEERTSLLATTYFDTPDARLRRGGATLRLREDGGDREQTLKLASAQGVAVRRQEWNMPAAGDRPDPSAFPADARSVLARLLEGEPLAAIATTRIERTVRRLQRDGAVIEVAFDRGMIEAGERREVVAELELELIEGELGAVLNLALGLPLGPGLRWSTRSKAQRGQALAYALPEAAVHAAPVALSSDMDVAQGFQAIGWNGLEHLLANYPLVVATGDPEALHQTRVAIRRLRAAGTLFAEVTADEAGPVLRAELKAVATALGPARDLHVLLERVAATARPGDGELDQMMRHLADRRDKAVGAAQGMLAAEPFQRLLFEFAAWLERGDWLEQGGTAADNQSLARFAGRVLSQRRRKLRRARGRLASMTDAERHRVRIATKKLRYATAFFASLVGDKAQARDHATFAKALEQLQDSLGELNDMAVATSGQAALFADLEPIAAARDTAQLEAVLASHAHSRRTLLKAAGKALDEIASAPAWWKAGFHAP